MGRVREGSGWMGEWRGNEGKELIAWKWFKTPAWSSPPPDQCILAYCLLKSIPDYFPV